MEDRLPVMQGERKHMLAAIVQNFAKSRLERELLARAYELVCPPPGRDSDAMSGQVVKCSAALPVALLCGKERAA